MDVHVTKHTRAGAFLWAVRMGGAEDDTGRGIAVGSGGTVFVAGTYRQSATFGPTTLTVPATMITDAFLVKMDAGTGGAAWARNGITIATGFPFGVHKGATGAGVAVDAAGNAYVVAAVGSTDTTISRVAPDGSRQWRHNIRFVEAHSGAIAVSGGSVYVAGNVMTSSNDFDPGPGKVTIPRSGGNVPGFVLRLTTGGSFGWVRQFAGVSGGDCIPDSLAVDAAGNVYSSGNFFGTVDFDPGTGTQTLNGGTGAGFVTKLNASGNLVWARQFGAKLGGSSDLAPGPHSSAGAMAVDAAGTVYLTTGFTGTADFDPGAGVFNLTSAGGSDTAVVKLDTNGTFLWAVSAGAAGDDYGTGIAVNPFGEIVVTGRVGGGTVDFDPATTYLDDRDLLTTAAPTGFLWLILQP
jgi:hypothetical protein